MTRLFDATYTIAEYRTHLGRLLGLYEPLERAVKLASVPAGFASDLTRSTDLRHDLRTIGATTEEIDGLARCSRLPPIAPGGVRGCTYVILGSMLGGQLIAARLRAVLGEGASLRFYAAGDGRFEERWSSFCADLEEHGEDDLQAICATAAAVFEAYAAWFAAPLVGTRR